MPGNTLFSIIESPAHPDFSRLYQRLGFEEIRLGSMRKAISQLRKTPPAFVVAEFFYGYGNNYAGGPQAVRLCTSAPATYRPRCYEGIGTILGSLHRYGDERRAACNAVTPKRYRPDCYRGAAIT